MDEKLPKTIELPESSIIHLILAFRFACKHLEDCSNVATQMNWHDLCWLQGKQSMETLTQQEREKMMTDVIEFEQLPPLKP